MINIKDRVLPGRHILQLSGVLPAGELVVLYQFIAVTARPGDSDGDGIPDEVDRCPFIREWYDLSGNNLCLMSVQGGETPQKSGSTTRVINDRLTETGDNITTAAVVASLFTFLSVVINERGDNMPVVIIKKPKNILDKLSICTIMVLVLLAVTLFDFGPAGGRNIEFYVKWIWCGNKPLRTFNPSYGYSRYIKDSPLISTGSFLGEDVGFSVLLARLN